MDSSEVSWSPVNNVRSQSYHPLYSGDTEAAVGALHPATPAAHPSTPPDSHTDMPPTQNDANQQSQAAPQRLSALYQYHNAPEVAPAHGLEYDDTVYPVSDKFPVVREAPGYDAASTIRYTGKHAVINDNRPPRIIFGMKVKTFLMVAVVMVLIVVGAAVGGAVGGKNMRENQNLSSNMNEINPNPTGTTPPTSTSTFVAATPTYTPLSDCPASNDTLYTSTFASGSSGDVPPAAGLAFTKYCNFGSPLTAQTGARRIAEAFVYSFSDCVELCAGANFWNANANCTVAVYQPEGARPGNCWVGNAAGVELKDLERQEGTDVAMLERDAQGR